ncbi:MAG: ubiquinol-cytochrome c reductase iron-sulfur subunit [Betaproteobacteria bacterium]|nr:ubiquinol-cytochrome c reductase iron-sulfur subunit [Betaproteobacteria bacterium]
MSEAQSDPGRRKFLVGATVVVGAAGVAAAATPFVLSMFPSARAKAAGAPVEVDISKVEPGMMITQEWRGQPVWVINRTPEMLAQLAKNADLLRDPNSEDSNQPDYCKNINRATVKHPNLLVVVGICTHLGCSPVDKMKAGDSGGMGSDWPGGFFCPCHGSKYDMSGRVFKSMPAPLNLRIPPYTFITDSRLLIGDDKKGA